ncbi:hypothetical protein [Bacillus velezensis]
MKKGTVFLAVTPILMSLSMVVLPTHMSAKETCSMTINSGKNTDFESAVSADGACSNLVYGYYADDQFVVNGLVNEVVGSNGQQFTVYTPNGKGETTLTVNTILNSEPKPDPDQIPKPTKEQNTKTQSDGLDKKTKAEKKYSQKTQQHSESEDNASKVEKSEKQHDQGKSEIQKVNKKDEEENKESESVKKEVKQIRSDSMEEKRSNSFFPYIIGAAIVVLGIVGGVLWYRRKE